MAGKISNIPELALSSTGKTIPSLGLGTATYPFGGSDSAKEAILHAIKLGYTHFDTAAIYQTEQNLGEAISEAFSLGHIKSRDQLFITSKLWISDAHQDRVLLALQNTLKNLRLEYLDLYLIHFPVALKPGKPEFPFDQNELLLMDFKAVWEAMEECQKIGLTRSIGVSNFSCKKLQDLLATAKIPPAVNQVEINPVWQQKKLREFCEKKGILVVAYSPLGAKGELWGTNRVMESEVIRQIADAKGKTVAQICLRWAHEQGVGIVVKSFDKNRMKENLDIFEWKLNSEELQKIDAIPQQKAYNAIHFTHCQGPYKTVDEFWDGEI